jgi:hypothetical protein
MIRSGGSSEATIVAARWSRLIAISGTVSFGLIGVAGPLSRYPNWVKHVPGFVAYLAVLAVAVIWGCSRSWRMELRMDNRGVTVRNYFRTYRIGWPEVSSFADGAVNAGAGGRTWALKVIRRNGSAVTACGTCIETSKGPPRGETLTAIRQCAERYCIPADVTGSAVGRGGPITPVLMIAILVLAWLFGANVQ